VAAVSGKEILVGAWCANNKNFSSTSNKRVDDVMIAGKMTTRLLSIGGGTNERDW